MGMIGGGCLEFDVIVGVDGITSGHPPRAHAQRRSWRLVFLWRDGRAVLDP
jgi:hypothetical protein